MQIIRQRLKECVVHEHPDHMRKCQKLKEDFDKVSENFCIKCKSLLFCRPSPVYIKSLCCVVSYILDGDLGPTNNVKDAYFKQKHRMLWERRHGPVGSGMKTQDSAAQLE